MQNAGCSGGPALGGLDWSHVQEENTAVCLVFIYSYACRVCTRVCESARTSALLWPYYRRTYRTYSCCPSQSGKSEALDSLANRQRSLTTELGDAGGVGGRMENGSLQSLSQSSRTLLPHPYPASPFIAVQLANSTHVYCNKMRGWAGTGLSMSRPRSRPDPRIPIRPCPALHPSILPSTSGSTHTVRVQRPDTHSALRPEAAVEARAERPGRVGMPSNATEELHSTKCD
ncbi:hypothetical protein F4803DRAFT_284727 [Xylaria telfairii]|nr:hypothetical protein F4803DRAFT_284727 [Xylaria telfairii]